jgi:hypothetical protein
MNFRSLMRIAMCACIAGLSRDSSGKIFPGKGVQKRIRGKERANADGIGIGGFPRRWEGLRRCGNTPYIVSPARDIALKLDPTRPCVRAAV